MTTRTKTALRGPYGLVRFGRLYFKWLVKNLTLRNLSGGDLGLEEARALAASYMFCLAITILMCILLPVEFYIGNIGAIAPLTGFLVLCLGLTAYISVTNKTTASIFIIAAYAFGMCAYFLWRGLVNEHTVIYYFWVIPVAVVFLNARLGAIFSVLFIGVLVVLFLPPVHAHLAIQLTPGFRFRFILAIICLFLVSAMAEYYLHLMFKAIFGMHRELEKYSLTDTLTGQGNRRNFINQFQRLHALQLRSGEPFTLVMADLDHFKKVNDNYGHLVGDLVLIFVAEILGQTLRGQDSLYRWGGEEFIILLPGTTQEQGKVAAERMRLAIENSQFHKDGLKIDLTASFGVYTVGTAQPMHEHIKNTDTLLYQAKAAGRNCVMGSDEGSGMIIAVN